MENFSRYGNDCKLKLYCYSVHFIPKTYCRKAIHRNTTDRIDSPNRYVFIEELYLLGVYSGLLKFYSSDKFCLGLFLVTKFCQFFAFVFGGCKVRKV